MENLTEAIAEKSGMTLGEVEMLIAKKSVEFSGIIDDSHAARLVAMDLGIKLEHERREQRYSSFAEIVDGKLNPASFVSRVMQVYSPKDFESNGRKGKVCNIEVAHATGKAVMVFWNDDVKFIEENALERNAVIAVSNAGVKNYNPLEFHTGLLTQVKISGEELGLPESKVRKSKLAEIREGDTVDFEATITEMRELNEFDKNGKTGAVLRCTVFGNGTQATLVLWDYHARQAVRKLKVGSRLKVEGAQARKGNGGLELHTNWMSNLVFLDSGKEGRKKKNGDEGSEEKEPESKAVGELGYGESSLVEAEVVEISFAGAEDGKLHAEAFLRSTEEDAVQVNFKGKTASDLLGLRNVPRIDLETVLQLKHEYLKGKRLELVVRRDKEAWGAKYYAENVASFK